MVGEQDPGVLAIQGVYEDLMVDEEWSLRSDRAFTWWSYRLAQTVSAGPPIRQGDLVASVVRASTDVVRNVPADRDPTPLLSIVNRQQTMNSLAWDPERAVVREQCSALVHEESLPWMRRVLTIATLLQVTAARSRAIAVAEALGGEPAVTQHPSGERSEMDDILNAPAATLATGPDEPSAFAGPGLEAVPEFARSMGFFATGDATGVTCEVPFTNDIPAAALQGEVPGTALVRILTEARHPQFGAGALILMFLPDVIPSEELDPIANRLNLDEYTNGEATHHLGAWCPRPDTEQPGLAFNCFLPNALAMPGLMENMVVYMANRARFAAHTLGLNG